jgi:hypothetical protein
MEIIGIMTMMENMDMAESPPIRDRPDKNSLDILPLDIQGHIGAFLVPLEHKRSNLHTPVTPNSTFPKNSSHLHYPLHLLQHKFQLKLNEWECERQHEAWKATLLWLLYFDVHLLFPSTVDFVLDFQDRVFEDYIHHHINIHLLQRWVETKESKKVRKTRSPCYYVYKILSRDQKKVYQIVNEEITGWVGELEQEMRKSIPSPTPSTSVILSSA